MKYYPNSECVPMKFHYALFGFIVPIRIIANIGGLPEILDLEKTLRGTAYDWYGKFGFVSVLGLIAIGLYTEYCLIKRIRNCHFYLIAMWFAEVIVKMVAYYVSWEFGAGSSIGTMIVMVALYIALIAVCYVYYEKRKCLFNNKTVRTI